MGFGVYHLVMKHSKFSNAVFCYREREEDQMLADMIQKLGKGPLYPMEQHWVALWLSGVGLNLPCVCTLSCRWISGSWLSREEEQVPLIQNMEVEK